MTLTRHVILITLFSLLASNSWAQDLSRLQGVYDGSEYTLRYTGISSQTGSTLFRSGEEVTKGAVMFDVAPLIFFDFYKENFITREDLSEQYDSLTFHDSERTEGDYRVVKRLKVSGGVGPALVAILTDRPALDIVRPYIGFAPLAGIKATSVRKSTSLWAGELQLPLLIPRHADTIEEKWNVGESLTYSVEGGAYFVAGLSAFFLSTGANYVVKGEFETTIKKKSADIVEVTLSKTKMKSIGVVSSSTVVSVDSSRFKEETLRFSFEYDLRRPVARAALENFLAGDVHASQVLANDGDGAGIYPSSRETLRSTGKIKNFSFGVPFLYWTNWGKGQVHTLRFKEEFSEGAEIDVEIGISLKTKEKRHVMTKIMETTSFYGTQGIELTGAGQIIRRMQGVFSHTFRRSKATRRQLENQLEDLRRMTGLKKEFTLDLPDERRLGALELEFNMVIDEFLTAKLMRIATSDNAKSNLLRIASELESSYTEKLSQENKLSKIEGDDLDICQGHNLLECQEKARSETDTSINEAYQALIEMSRTYRSDREKFVEHYAEFGRAWLASPFTFQTFFNLIKNDGLKASLELASGKTDKLSVGYQWR